MSASEPSSTPSVDEDAVFEQISTDVSNCMLDQTMGTVVGVAAGLAIGLRRKSVTPLILTTILGSTADLGFGYYNACSGVIEDFLIMKQARDDKKVNN